MNIVICRILKRAYPSYTGNFSEVIFKANDFLEIHI